jgi:hypothetical protein
MTARESRLRTGQRNSGGRGRVAMRINANGHPTRLPMIVHSFSGGLSWARLRDFLAAGDGRFGIGWLNVTRFRSLDYSH